ncbi:hypothetical protein [Microbaculum marinum]|uniref:Uncharacterized protein n=1 Tax=Microbaculum marinum TaxID=1764581 RepID=A0AAW9RPI4_9HYPH
MEPDGTIQSDATYQVAFLGMSSPALTPGLPPPQLVGQPSGEGTVMSTRSVAAGLILVLFAGLAALTFTMWRDLGRRVGVR